MNPNHYEIKIMEILTRPKTEFWVFYRPVRQETKKEIQSHGFRVIHGNFIVSFK